MLHYKINSPVKERLLVVSAALINDQNHVLMCQRPLHKPMGGLWEFPGGKLESNETPEQALCRELKEELGIEISKKHLLPFTFVSHEYDDFHLLMPVFICSSWRGEARALEHQEICWVSPQDMHKYPILEADLALVNQIINIFS